MHGNATYGINLESSSLTACNDLCNSVNLYKNIQDTLKKTLERNPDLKIIISLSEESLV